MVQKKSTSYFSLFFEISLLASLFFVMFELAAGGSFYIMESCLLFLVVTFTLYLLSKYGFAPFCIIKVLGEKIRSCWIIVVFLFLYIAWDIYTTTYAISYQGFWDKYKVVLLMLFLSVAMLFYAADQDRINRVLLTITSAGIFSAVFSVVNYMFLRIYPIYYGKRFSIRLDYNMFASVLMMGMIVGFFLIMINELSPIQEAWAFLILFECIVPIIILSSSRRNYLLLFPISLILVADYLWCSFSGGGHMENEKREKKKRQIIAIFTPIIILTAVISTIFLLNIYLCHAYAQLKNSDKGTFLMEGEGSAQSRYETIENEAVQSKRGLIWGIAVNEAKSYTAKEKLIGRGFGYDRSLYSHTKNEELDAAYNKESKEKLSAHCFVLADLLNGGWVQVMLAVCVWGSIGVYLLLLLRAYFMFAQLYVFCFGLVFMNNFISNRFGFLYDKFFWIFLVLLLCEIQLIQKNQRRIFVKLGTIGRQFY